MNKNPIFFSLKKINSSTWLFKVHYGKSVNRKCFPSQLTWYLAFHILDPQVFLNELYSKLFIWVMHSGVLFPTPNIALLVLVVNSHDTTFAFNVISNSYTCRCICHISEKFYFSSYEDHQHLPQAYLTLIWISVLFFFQLCPYSVFSSN